MERIAAGRKNRFTTFEIRSDLEKVDAIYRSLADPLLRRIDGQELPDEVHQVIVEQLRELGCT